ncbi:MAG: MFS transporter [Chloroflexi bacterium]|nr:MFS transporter [Chloroflexota bacterium]
MPWYGVIVLNMAFVGILFGFVPVYLNSLGYDSFGAGLILAAGTLAYLLIQPLAGRLADRFGGHATISVGLFMSSASIVMLPFSQGLSLLALVVLGGIGIGIVWTNSDLVISQLAQSGQLSTTLGAAGSYKEIGDMLGPLSIGVLAQVFGIAVGFVACGLAGLTGLLLIQHRSK